MCFLYVCVVGNMLIAPICKCYFSFAHHVVDILMSVNRGASKDVLENQINLGYQRSNRHRDHITPSGASRVITYFLCVGVFVCAPVECVFVCVWTNHG